MRLTNSHRLRRSPTWSPTRLQKHLRRADHLLRVQGHQINRSLLGLLSVVHPSASSQKKKMSAGPHPRVLKVDLRRRGSVRKSPPTQKTLWMSFHLNPSRHGNPLRNARMASTLHKAGRSQPRSCLPKWNLRQKMQSMNQKRKKCKNQKTNPPFTFCHFPKTTRSNVSRTKHREQSGNLLGPGKPFLSCV